MGSIPLQETCQESQREDKIERRKTEKKITARYIYIYVRRKQEMTLPLADGLTEDIAPAYNFSPAC